MRKRILIVDDNVFFLDRLSMVIERYCDYPVEIKTAVNGENAIIEVSTFFYDTCFLDINLPDISGLDVMRRIHYLSPGTRVVIMTADYIDSDIKKIIEDGAALFLSKPVELHEIRDFMKQESNKR